MRRVGLSICFIGLLAALAAGGWRVPAAAQDSSQGVGVVEFPINPEPADCQVQPRTTDNLIALRFGPDGRPVAAAPIEEAAAGVTVPIGIPADAATVSSIIAAIHEVYACFETGDFLRTSALFTDNLARRFGAGPDVTEADARAFLAAPEPATEAEASEIVAVLDVMLLADGRVGAFVIDRSADEGTHVGHVVLLQEGDRWLADEAIEFGGVESVEE